MPWALPGAVPTAVQGAQYCMTEPHRVTIREAAKTLGVSVDTIKRRIRVGALPAGKGSNGVWLVELPNAAPGVMPGAMPNAVAAGVQGALPHAETTLRAECSGLRERLADRDSEIAFLRDQLRSRDEQLRARDEEIHRAHILAQQAQQQVKLFTDQRQQPPEPPKPRWRRWLGR